MTTVMTILITIAMKIAKKAAWECPPAPVPYVFRRKSRVSRIATLGGSYGDCYSACCQTQLL